MARAFVYCPPFDVFNPPALVQGGFVQEFPVYFTGPDVPDGSAVDAIQVTLLDTDNAAAQQAAIRDAARTKATNRGFTVAVNDVTAFSTPTRL